MSCRKTGNFGPTSCLKFTRASFDCWPEAADKEKIEPKRSSTPFHILHSVFSPVIKYLRRTWQIRTGRVETPFDGGVPFWVISLIAHLVLILLIAKLIVPSVEDRSSANLSATSEAVEVFEEVTPDVEFEDMMEDNSGADRESDASVDEAELAMTVIDMQADAPEEDLDLDFSDDGFISTGIDGMENGAEAFAEIATKGEAGTAVAAASGAVDRVSEEILESLEKNKTLVVWLFDQSGSLQEQRSQIMKRLDKVYQDLEASGLLGNQDQAQLQNQRLLTDVIAFGNTVNPMLKKPTALYDQASEAIGEIELDTTGVEKVMEAVTLAANKYKWMHKIDSDTKKRKRNIRFIIVSDEAGDDGDKTDMAVKICRANQIPVYVIGVPAPFGRQQTNVKWVDPDPSFDQSPQVAKVTQGPESLMAERLQLDLTGDAGDLEMIDSGFGPFNLTRLCYETGGIYFAVHPNRRSNRGVRWAEVSNYSAFLRHFFDSETMKAYRPDYVSRAAYQSALKKSALRSSLVRAAAFTSAGTLETPQLEFPNFDEAQFVRIVSRAQRDAAIIEPKLNQLFEILKAGEPSRMSESSLRWQAGYDLAIGQALAAKIRAETYNMMLAMVKTSKKFDPPKNEKEPQNNTWLLRPADTVTTGSRSEKMATKAKTYLQRVVDKHPDTPWAMIAQRELDIPIGWQWRQTYTVPPEMRERRPQDPSPTPNKEMDKQAPKRKPPNL